jgi:protein gp37
MQQTKIDWATHTWNPVTGCTFGCSYCYARRIATRFMGTKAFPNGFEPTLHPDRLREPLSSKKPARVFLCSMGELFQPAVPLSFIDDILEVIAATPRHTYLALTKQPQRIEEALYGWAGGDRPARELGGGDYLSNLWLGVSAENQTTANQRIPPLLKAWSGHKFVSCEPIMSHTYLMNWLGHGLEWVIVGAKTPVRNPKHLPAAADALGLARQCGAAKVPIFMKEGLRHYIQPEWFRQEYPTEMEERDAHKRTAKGDSRTMDGR